ncbi:LysR substrate-binding domain-containing protein [Pandoraea sp. PE-S2R-1]|uniref:LysR substrate-binding domain-containing protein n=1 Tax=Pandoraea sp. PE-S2R-1 TaxID=1986994 RepID=UPI000B3F73D8|nr:LysR substrate-binding domain-containing protein [Pandoraea sp. PE-S2R-1]
MNIRQLEAFRATVMAGTVNGAAEMLGTSQSTVSRLIGHLERSLALPLFDRANGRLAVTPEGQLIFEQAEHAYRSYERIRELAGDVRQNRVGHIAIACMPALGLSFLPGVIKAFCEKYPGVTISLEIQSSTRVEDWIAAQRTDFGLAELPFSRADVAVDEFCRVPYYAILPPGHALAAKRELQPRDVDGLPFISMTSVCQVRHHVDQFFDAHGVRRVTSLETSYLQAVSEFVHLGMGVALADPFTVHANLDRVVARPMRPSLDFGVGLLYPRHRPLPKVCRTFIAFMREYRDRCFAEVAARCGV